MYQALYRKWRPKIFDDVVGQNHITETLKNQISTGRLSHAYLFIGTRGTGKTTCAKILAKALNCENPVNGNPCCKCPACIGIESGGVLDVVEIDAASNNGVDNVRQLREEAVFSPVSVKKRVYIIDEVHMLSTAAFNALLKILEEPPEHLAFILATTELNKVPATILSRCQRHSFKRLDSDLITAHLEHVAKAENLSLDHDAAKLIAGLAEGGMRDALSLLDQCSGVQHIDVNAVYSSMGLTGNRRTAKLLDYAIKHDTENALLLFEELWNDGKDPATFLGELNTLLRDCLMASVAPHSAAALLSGRFDSQTLAVFSKKLTKSELLSRINTVSDYLSKINNTKNPKLTVELCIIALSEPTLIDGIDELRARVSRIEEDIKHAPVTKYIEEDEESIPVTEIPYDDADAPPLQRECNYEEPVEDVSPTDLNPDASEEAANAPLDSSELWSAIIEKLDPSLISITSILSNPDQVRCEIDYDTMHIFAEKTFSLGQINKPDVIMRIRSAAQDVTGRSLKVTVSELTEDESKPKRSLDDLKQFKETRFL